MVDYLTLFKDYILPGLKTLGGIVLGCLWEKVGHMYNFKGNLELLKKDLGELIAKRDTVLLRVNTEVDMGGQMLPTVGRWLSQVETIEKNINQLLVEVSAQGASSNDASTQGASSNDASAQGASTHDARTQDAFAQGVSTHDARTQDASAQGASAQAASAQGASTHDARTQDASAQGASAQAASAHDSSVQGASTHDARTQDASAQGVSTHDARYAQDASAQGASILCASSQDASTCGCLPLNCNLGEEVFRMLNEVKSLSSEIFEEVTKKAPPPVVVERNCQQTFGLDSTLERAWEGVMRNRMFGIHGMGGVGKTTLLTLINNKYVGFECVDIVIWVTVAKDEDVEDDQDNKVKKVEVVIKKIQDTIGERLHLYDENWSTYSRTKKASHIRRVLISKPRFVLLLDDLWEDVSLSKIGIPMGGREHKIVFSTRSQDVCGNMGANDKIIEVKCLAAKDALDLFMHNCTRSGDFLDIAKEIAAKCCGLPLALEVIGKTLASTSNIGRWRSALRTLKSYPNEWGCTETNIFQVLKLSYDNLEEKEANKTKLCFLYCALFPNAHIIKKDELVEYWISEEFINEKGGRQPAKDRGYEIIETLVRVGLLLNDSESEEKVYMHDMIREMALWIVSKLGDGEKYIVQAGAGLSELPIVMDWTTVTKMSLMNNQIESIPDDSEFPNPDRLVTLFLQNNKLVNIVGRFFRVLSTLVVLDLAGNHDITKLPEVSELVSLRYLSLLGTRINELPLGLGELDKLIHLDLESTPNLGSIDLILGLKKLQVLRFYGSKASLDGSLLKHLNSLKVLQVLTISVRDVGVLEEFLRSKLAGRTQGLYLQGLRVSVASFAATFGVFGSLRSLKMINCDIMESETDWEGKSICQYSPSTSSNQITPSNPWFENLSAVVLLSCEHVKDLTWLMYCENLESLSITLSPKMEQVISKKKAQDVGVEPFLKLQVLALDYLDELKGIYWSPLSFPSLKKVNIKNCPNLRKLPLNSTIIDVSSH